MRQHILGNLLFLATTFWNRKVVYKWCSSNYFFRGYHLPRWKLGPKRQERILVQATYSVHMLPEVQQIRCQATRQNTWCASQDNAYTHTLVKEHCTSPKLKNSAFVFSMWKCKVCVSLSSCLEQKHFQDLWSWKQLLRFNDSKPTSESNLSKQSLRWPKQKSSVGVATRIWRWKWHPS